MEEMIVSIVESMTICVIIAYTLFKIVIDYMINLSLLHPGNKIKGGFKVHSLTKYANSMYDVKLVDNWNCIRTISNISEDALMKGYAISDDILNVEREYYIIHGCIETLQLSYSSTNPNTCINRAVLDKYGLSIVVETCKRYYVYDRNGFNGRNLIFQDYRDVLKRKGY